MFPWASKVVWDLSSSSFCTFSPFSDFVCTQRSCSFEIKVKDVKWGSKIPRPRSFGIRPEDGRIVREHLWDCRRWDSCFVNKVGGGCFCRDLRSSRCRRDSHSSSPVCEPSPHSSGYPGPCARLAGARQPQ